MDLKRFYPVRRHNGAVSGDGGSSSSKAHSDPLHFQLNEKEPDRNTEHESLHLRGGAGRMPFPRCTCSTPSRPKVPLNPAIAAISKTLPPGLKHCCALNYRAECPLNQHEIQCDEADHHGNRIRKERLQQTAHLVESLDHCNIAIQNQSPRMEDTVADYSKRLEESEKRFENLIPPTLSQSASDSRPPPVFLDEGAFLALLHNFCDRSVPLYLASQDHFGKPGHEEAP